MAISQIVQNSLANTISLGPKITSVQVANSSYTVLDDTSINIGGGFIVITGSGFQSNCSVIVDSNLACSVAFVSATQVRAQLPAKPAGTYNIYLLNGDGGTAIRVNALQYSNTPTWVTESPLATQVEDTSVSIQLSASGANTYALQTGSTLPTGLTLSANGLISGTVNTNISTDTTYNFTVEAIDTENQETPKAFAVTISLGDPTFTRTVLLLSTDTTNSQNNNVFRDSSNGNLAITRVGNATQGAISPFIPGWSIYCDGTGDRISNTSSNFAFGTGPFCIEFWVFNNVLKNYSCGATTRPDNGSYSDAWHIGWDEFGGVSLYIGTTSSPGGAAGTMKIGQWQHFVCCRNSNSNTSIFVDGTRVGTATITANLTRTLLGIGDFATTPAEGLNGYISDVRLVKGSSVYDPTQSSITVPTSPLTAVANTVLLAASSNRFIDKSNAAAVFTRSGNPMLISQSPYLIYNQGAVRYTESTHVGSAYFDADGDRLTVAASSPFDFGTGNFTVEFWIYKTGRAGTNQFSDASWVTTGAPADGTGFGIFGRQVAEETEEIGLLLASGTGGGAWSLNIGTGTNISKGEWSHIALVRSGNVFTMYKNGTSIYSTTQSYDIRNTNNLLSIGGRSSYSQDFKGYISNLRIVKGTAVYTGNFTIPAAPVVPITNTEFLLNGVNGGILDYTMENVIETVGDARVNTSVVKYNTGSIAFDGNADILKTTPGISHLYAFRKQDFTVEGWFYFNAVGNYSIIDWRSQPASNDPAFFTDGSGYVGWYVNQASRIMSSIIPPANQWHHIAVCRSGTSTRLFINGTQSGSTYTDTFDYGCADGRPWFGALSDGTGTLYYNGLMDDVRITKGFARYTSNFTVPSTYFPRQ